MRNDVGDDETQKMAAMDVWLDDVCSELGVDRAVLDSHAQDLLLLIKDVAHGPSRPGAPMTAFLVGFAAGAATGPAADAVSRQVAAVNSLLARWDDASMRPRR